ncbi:MAG: hypothetical protein ACYC4I_02700 [Minisyncoccota bacterium]
MNQYKEISYCGLIEQKREGRQYIGYVLLAGMYLGFKVSSSVLISDIVSSGDLATYNADKVRGVFKIELKKGTEGEYFKLEGRAYDLFFQILVLPAVQFCMDARIIRLKLGIKPNAAALKGTSAFSSEACAILSQPEFGCVL